MLHHPQATREALAILRTGETFSWYVITLLAVVVYIYVNEISKGNWKNIAAGLSLYILFISRFLWCPCTAMTGSRAHRSRSSAAYSA
jgi:hypothetical protein